ncbi:hypothetical protein BJY04DRAFT_212793 [Aspergillus karnatakaensis]|uniref:uncharacterized protein n=1 Tax=Aspergillus karnatakaensis TaxID=1810916 RepID=UPI003CCDBE78
MDNSSDDTQTDLAYTANRIAVSALALAVAAFVVGFFQLLIGNLISSTLRWKTNQAAIGVSARQRTWGLSYGKVKIYYPEIDFSYRAILAALVESEYERVSIFPGARDLRRHDISGLWVASKKKAEVDEYDDSEEKRTFDPDETERQSLSAPGREDLTWFERLQDLIYVIRLERPQMLRTYRIGHGRKRKSGSFSRPRATWAQLVQAAGINDTSALTLGHEDADSIPTSIDVPIQRPRLFDIGCLALLLGFESVKINAETRVLQAVSPYGTITTEEIPTFGKVIRFEGDIQSISKSKFLRQWQTARSCWLAGAMCFAVGNIDVGCFNGDAMAICVIETRKQRNIRLDGRSLPLKILFQAVIENWSFEYYAQMVDLFYFRGAPTIQEFIHEANILLGTGGSLSSPTGGGNDVLFMTNRSQSIQDIVKSIAEWQARANLTVPTILAASSFAGLPMVTCGFPSEIMLLPFLPWFQLESRSLSEMFQQVEADISFVKVSHSLLESRFYSPNVGSAPLGRLPPTTSFGFTGWGFGALGSLREIMPDEVRSEMPPPCTSGNARINIKAPLLPQMVQLIEDFNPIKWAEDFTAARYRYKDRQVNPQNLLWLQITALDIVIRLHIRGSLDDMDKSDIAMNSGDALGKDGKWSTAERNVLLGIVMSWDPTALGSQDKVIPKRGPQRRGQAPTTNQQHSPEKNDPTTQSSSEATRQGPVPGLMWSELSSKAKASPSTGKLEPWDLQSALEKYAQIDFGGDTQQSKREYKKLAMFLKLRGLLLIAFLMVGVDSSDVYLAGEHDIKMPFV